MQEAPRFDPVTYKRTTYRQWEDAAEAWHHWGPTLRSWLGPATERMLDLARVVSGHRVLDVAAGAGDQSFAVAERVGPKGHVLATDLSPAILEFAAADARAALAARAPERGRRVVEHVIGAKVARPAERDAQAGGEKRLRSGDRIA